MEQTPNRVLLATVRICSIFIPAVLYAINLQENAAFSSKRRKNACRISCCTLFNSLFGMDEISLKKRHKLYVTILTDLTRPEQPQVLVVARQSKAKLSRAQR